MPRRKFTDAQIALVVKELENGARVEDVCRKLGVSTTFGTTHLAFSGESITTRFVRIPHSGASPPVRPTGQIAMGDWNSIFLQTSGNNSGGRSHIRGTTLIVRTNYGLDPLF